jgi:macrolide transport system ATP-binding/permease protein
MSLLRRIGNLFSRNKLDREVDAEVQAHIEMRIEDNLAEGMSPEQARRDALIRFGSPTATKERVNGMDAALTLESIWADIRFACRQLINNPGFAATAIVVLALGVGASVAIFAFVDAVLIKPLPYQDPGRLVALFESTQLGPRYHLSYLDYVDWKQLNSTMSAVEPFDNDPFAMGTPGGPQRVDGATVGTGFFRALGVEPVLGRDFREGEDLKGAQHVAMISYAAWQKRYARRTDALGQSVTLDDVAHTIVGVLPKEFYFAPVGASEYFVPMRGATDAASRGGHGILALGRIRDGVTQQAAAANMNAIAAQLAAQYPDADGGRGATVVPLADLVVGNLRPVLFLLLAGAALLLLIASTNVSSLLLVRSENRQREIAIRAALGASAARLIRQFLIEGLVLIVAGSAAGTATALAAIHLLKYLLPPAVLDDMPYLRELGLNVHVSAFLACIGLASAILFALPPAIRFTVSKLRTGLVDGGRAASGTAWRRVGSTLVVIELSTAVVLLVGAGLLGKSFYRLLHIDIGMVPDHLATLRVAAPQHAYQNDHELAALSERIIEETSRLSGVESVAVAHQIPVANMAGGNTTFQIVGKPPLANGTEASSRQVSAGFFNTIRARIAAGRYFSDSDRATSPRVAIINHAFAKRYFPGEDPIGKQLNLMDNQPPATIVGIVEDLKEGPLDAAAQPVIYSPFSQGPDDNMVVVARTIQAPQAYLKAIEDAVHRVDPGFLTLTSETMDDRINSSQAAYLHRASAWLVGGFAAVALLLGVVGLYGVIAYSVSQRTREIGVRMALGAQRGSVYALVMKEAAWITTLGIAAGLAGSVAAAMLMRKLLFGTQPWDAPTLAAVAALLGAFALLASFIPARRAASVNPVDALRSE